MKAPRLKSLGRLWGLRIYLVSGEQVRNELDLDYTAGGHEAIYSYVPRGEVWIDNALSGLCRTATVVHEILERDLMLRYGMGYDKAHDRACAFERTLRVELRRAGVQKYDARKASAALKLYRTSGANQRNTPRPIANDPRKLQRDIDEYLARR